MHCLMNVYLKCFLPWLCSAVNPNCYTVWYFSEKECVKVRQELAEVMDTSDGD